VRIGKLALLLVNMKKAVSYKLAVQSVMDGKNKSIIPTITRLSLVKKRNAMETLNVHSSTLS
jgi:hypothetical protein